MSLDATKTISKIIKDVSLAGCFLVLGYFFIHMMWDIQKSFAQSLKENTRALNKMVELNNQAHQLHEKAIYSLKRDLSRDRGYK